MGHFEYQMLNNVRLLSELSVFLSNLLVELLFNAEDGEKDAECAEKDNDCLVYIQTDSLPRLSEKRK